ncbi:MAG: glycine cleavage system protein GcvH [Magnetospiraceae bacterium]
MAKTKYSKDHEWVEVADGIATVGISDYAQEQLGDVVFVELPNVDREVDQGDEIAVIESVKAASELYAPVSGTVVEINEDLAEDPAVINADPLGEGWFLKISLSDPSEIDDLMSEDDYQSYVDGLDE